MKHLLDDMPSADQPTPWCLHCLAHRLRRDEQQRCCPAYGGIPLNLAGTVAHLMSTVEEAKAL